jgi:AcrR family transcriptional regulator
LARPAHFTDDALLQAAYDVFREQGMDATTAEIARRAGASEGTLFKRFQSKAGLFHAVLGHSHQLGDAWTDGLAPKVGAGRLADQLEAIAGEGIDFFRVVVPLHMVSGMSPSYARTAPEAWGKSHPALEARRKLEGYFEAERRLGRVGKVDVEVLARTFMGALYNFAVMEVMTAPYEPSPLPQEKFVRHLVAMLLHGIAGEGPRDRPSPRKTATTTRTRTR